MKKIIYICALCVSLSASSYAVCSIQDGFCSSNSSLSRPVLENKFLPNKLDEIQKPDSFQPRIVQPYNDMLINMEPAGRFDDVTPTYNANCQFGTCLPGENLDTPAFP